MIYITEILKTFISLFVIMNPFAAIPLYLTLTTNMQAEQREKIIKICSLSVFVVLFISAIAGEIILKVFGISIAAFQVGGGVLLSIIAYGMLSAKDEESTSDLKKENSILNKLEIVKKDSIENNASVWGVYIYIAMRRRCNYEILFLLMFLS